MRESVVDVKLALMQNRARERTFAHGQAFVLLTRQQLPPPDLGLRQRFSGR